MDQSKADNDEGNSADAGGNERTRLQKLSQFLRAIRRRLRPPRKVRNSLRTIARRSFRHLHEPRFLLEVAAFLGLVFYVSETRRTNNLTKQTLNEIIKNNSSTSAQTDKLINTSIKQSQTMETMSEASKAQAIATVQQLDAASARSKAVLQASIDALRIDQRPYIIRRPFVLNRAISPGPVGIYQFRASLGFVVAGKSPAISIRGYRIFRCYDIIPNEGQNAFDVEVERVAGEAFAAAKKTQPVFMAAMSPQLGSAEPPVPSMFDSRDINLSPTDFANIVARRSILLLTGFVTYRDALMKQTDPDHITEFCSYMLGESIAEPIAQPTQEVICRAHSDMR
jgi:hypothetical protein